MRILFTLLFLVSCATHTPKPEVKPEVQEQAPTEIALPAPELKTPVTLELSKFTPEQAARLEKIRGKVEIIINSEEFKKAVIDYYTNGKRKFNETTKSNEEIFEILVAKKWEVKIELARGGRNVLGWTNPNTQWIWFNSRYFDTRQNDGLAGTFCHEWSHKLKFGHAYRYYKGREYTVPYGLGTICALLYKD